MGRTSGTPNKITAEVRDKLQNLIDELVNSLDIQELDNNQKIKMLQIALQYTLPRLQAMMIKEEQMFKNKSNSLPRQLHLLKSHKILLVKYLLNVPKQLQRQNKKQKKEQIYLKR